MTVEADVIQFLKAHLSVPVSASVPKDRPARFVTVERVGGILDTFRDLPQLAIQSWGQSTSDAASLADEVRTLLPRLVSLPNVARVTVGSTYNYPDIDSGQGRYQTVCDLTVKAEYAA